MSRAPTSWRVAESSTLVCPIGRFRERQLRATAACRLERWRTSVIEGVEMIAGKTPFNPCHLGVKLLADYCCVIGKKQ
jgi:hypothetical protein